MRKGLFLAIWSAALGTFAFGQAASAQIGATEPAEPSVVPTQGSGLAQVEDIVVTARRTSDSIQTTPAPPRTYGASLAFTW